MFKTIRSIILAVCCGSLFVSNAAANGFKILGVKSAKAIAMGEAFIAQADDPSTIAFNPAGLTNLEGTQVSGQYSIMNGWFKRTSPTGVEESNLEKWQGVPAFYLTGRRADRPWGWGLGITVPNGISSEWSGTGFARYVTTYSNLVLVDVNPSLAWKVSDRFSAGVGISYYHSTAELKSKVDYATMYGLPVPWDGGSELSADGNAWGYNAGATYKLDERQTLAATFKSPFTVKYKGDATFTEIPPANASSKCEAKTSIAYPAVVVLGYAVTPGDRWKFEFNLDWTDWSTLDKLTVHYQDPTLAPTTFKYGYRDTIAYKLGAEYKLNDPLRLRAGYIYNQPAAPEEHWRPSLQDTVGQFLTTGLGYTRGPITIDTALQFVFYKTVHVNNNVDNNETISSSSIDGTYDDFGTALSVGVTYRF
ncbi:MAG TPA: outer membrane protein transport protein [Elusimicrobiota bacterium]|nr:outer membrane protein transport protein [Elusimicrobiota bacterium]